MRKHNPLLSVQGYGQSIWLDFVRRRMIQEGELQQMIAQDGLRGLTSNTSRFEQVISAGGDYDEDIRIMARQGRSEQEIYDFIKVKDIGLAADQFRPLYERSDGKHGFVSLEIDPNMAYDEAAIVEEARRIWRALDRPNVMIKIPGTEVALTSFRQLVSEGMNLNLTLIFSPERYRQAALAYIEALEARAAAQKPVTWMLSTATFFVSRIDAMVDGILRHREEIPDIAAKVREIYGRTGLASAKMAYRIYQEIFEGERFMALREKGALPQRLVWASIGPPGIPSDDIAYAEALIGPETILSMPIEILNAYREHGRPEARLLEDTEGAEELLQSLPQLDINMAQVARSLEEQGVERCIRSYDRIIETIAEARYQAL